MFFLENGSILSEMRICFLKMGVWFLKMGVYFKRKWEFVFLEK